MKVASHGNEIINNTSVKIRDMYALLFSNACFVLWLLVVTSVAKV